MEGKKEFKKLIMVISGPSTAGKSKVIKKLLNVSGKCRYITSYTTRKPRKEEVQNKDYIFISEQEFRLMVQKDAFLQWKISEFGFYGTPVAELRECFDKDLIPVLDLDEDSFLKLQALKYPVVGIFLLPPGLETLRQRIYNRGADRGIARKEDADLRFVVSLNKVKYSLLYDYLLVNKSEDETAELIGQIGRIESIKEIKTEIYNEWTKSINNLELFEGEEL